MKREMIQQQIILTHNQSPGSTDFHKFIYICEKQLADFQIISQNVHIALGTLFLNCFPVLTDRQKHPNNHSVSVITSDEGF